MIQTSQHQVSLALEQELFLFHTVNFSMLLYLISVLSKLIKTLHYSLKQTSNLFLGKSIHHCFEFMAKKHF